MTLAQKLTRLSIALINSPTQLAHYQDRVYPFSAPREVHAQKHIVYYPVSHAFEMLDGRDMLTRTEWRLVFREPLASLSVGDITPVIDRVETILREIIPSILPAEMKLGEIDVTRLSDATQILSVEALIRDDTGHA